jgi:hypothetical protein
MSWLKSFRTKAAIIEGVTIILVNLAYSCSNRAFQNVKDRIKIRIFEEIRVKTPVQIDFVQNVISGGTRSTTLQLTKTALHICYIHIHFSAF